MSFYLIFFDVPQAALANVDYALLLVLIDVEIKNRLEDLGPTEYEASYVFAN